MTEAKTHDYTRREWGHDYVFNPVEGGLKAHAMGWGYGISKEDFLILQNGDGSTRYKVDEIQYFTDPRDMWSAKLSFAPRPSS